MDTKNQLKSIVLIVIFVLGTIGLLWWSERPRRIPDDASVVIKPKEKKLSTDLFSDPRFQELRQGGGSIDIGTKGNANPFEPFTSK